MHHFKNYLFQVIILLTTLEPHYLNTIQDGEGESKKAPVQVFSPATSTNVRTGPEIVLIFRFYSFFTLMPNIKAITSASFISLNLNQGHPSKKFFFLSNPYTIEFMITFLVKIVELPNFGHMTTCKR